MANIIQIKRGTGTSALAEGELGFNTNTNILYIGNSGNKAIGGAGAFLSLNGGTLIGNLTISQNTNNLKEFRIKNNNGDLALCIDSSNRGLYDYENSKWICYAAINNSSWFFNGTATNAETATTANKVKNALTIKGNGTILDSFDGSLIKTIDITPANIGALSITGGTLTGSLRINTSSTSGGGVLINEDGEGGTIVITSKSGTYSYEIDAVTDSKIRVHNAPSHPSSFKSISWSAETGTLWTDALQLTSALAVKYGGTGATTPAGACTNIGAVSKSGDTMTGTLTVQGNVMTTTNGTSNTEFKATNNNGSISLCVENGRGIWDYTGNKWVISANSGSNNWILNISKITDISCIIYSTSQPTSGSTGQIWIKPV